MINFIKRIVKNIVLGAFVLYGYNLIAVNFNMMIPINYITLIIVSILGAPGLIVLILFKVLILWGD